MALTVEQVEARVREMRLRDYDRDQDMSNVRMARAGDMDRIIPGMLPDDWPAPVVANTIDIAARYFSEQIGFPTVSCTTGVMVSDRQKKYAMKRTLIAHHYMGESHLKERMTEAADWYDTYGFLPLVVEPFFGDGRLASGPRLRWENPLSCYYMLNSWGDTVCFAKVHTERVSTLAAKFPHLATRLVNDSSEMFNGTEVEMVAYQDKDQMVVFIPSRSNLVLTNTPNPMARCTVFIAERPKFDRRTRGSYDDAVWVQAARARMAMLGMEAAEKTVQAPLAIPADVQKISLGPDAVIRTANPQGVRRVGLEMSPAAFQEGQVLQQEVMQATRFPEAATGKSPGSTVTGAGVNALMGTVNTKVREAQGTIGYALKKAVAFAFEMDETLWPKVVREVRVMVRGNQFEETYTPAKDIAGAYQCDVTYGMAAGMDPNRAIVFLLQARGDKLISRDFALRQLPFDLNVDQVMQQIDTEELDDALKQGLFSMLGGLGAMAAQGADPLTILQQAATVIKEREKGTPLADAMLKAFQPPPTPPDAASGQPGAAPQQGPPGAPPQGAQGPAGPGAGAAPGGAPPGALPPMGGQGAGGNSIMQLLAGLSANGSPNMSANMKRQIPG